MPPSAPSIDDHPLRIPDVPRQTQGVRREELRNRSQRCQGRRRRQMGSSASPPRVPHEKTGLQALKGHGTDTPHSQEIIHRSKPPPKPSKLDDSGGQSRSDPREAFELAGARQIQIEASGSPLKDRVCPSSGGSSPPRRDARDIGEIQVGPQSVHGCSSDPRNPCQILFRGEGSLRFTLPDQGRRHGRPDTREAVELRGGGSIRVDLLPWPKRPRA